MHSADTFSLSKMQDDIIHLCNKIISKKNWRIKSVLVLSCISIVLSTGAYFYLPTAMKDENWNSFNEKKDHPFTQTNYEPGSHAAKKTFRLTVPIIAKVFQLGNYAVFLLQFIVTILFLFFAIRFVEKITGDSITGLLTTIGLGFIYAGHAGFTDINTWFDEFAYLFLLLAMFSNQPYLILIFIQLACWTDERAIISSGLVFIWWKIKEEGIFSFKSFFSFKLNSSVVVFSLLLYASGRFLLASLAQLSTPLSNVGLKPLLSDTDFMGMALWTSLEGFWIPVLLTFFILWKYKNFNLLVSIFSLLLILALGSFSVFDKTRSGAYMFPVIFISILVLKNYFSTADIRKILFVTVPVCFLFPSYYIISDVKPYILWYKPIFVRVIDLAAIYLNIN